MKDYTAHVVAVLAAVKQIHERNAQSHYPEHIVREVVFVLVADACLGCAEEC